MDTEKSNEQSKEITAKVQGTIRKKSVGRKIAESFVSDETPSVGEYILTDILIPSIKKVIYDSVTNALNMILFGTKGAPVNKPRSSVSYNNMYNQPTITYQSRKTFSTLDYNSVEFDDRDKAVEAKVALQDILAAYPSASVADYYEICSISGSQVSGTHTDRNYGWTNVDSAVPVPCGGGKWTLKLPSVIPLK